VRTSLKPAAVGIVMSASNEPSPVPEVRRFSGIKPSPAHQNDTTVSDSSQTVGPKVAGPKRVVVRQQVPDEILHNEDLTAALQVLPANYNFEIHKTVWRLKQAEAKRVALQFPEGLLMFACALVDIFETFAGVDHCFVLGDVTYGACCVDDYSCDALGCDFLVHYGHSCLVPVDLTKVPTMYVFVDIRFDTSHLAAAIRHNFPANTRLAVAGTIQFASAIQAVRAELAHDYPALRVPQAKPLSPGEVLGCTAPALEKTGDDSTEAIVFVADGRFHLEAIMIANPTIPAYRYDPYGRLLTKEEYDHGGMRQTRRKFVEQARAATSWGVVLGTLGRQGNPAILQHLERRLKEKNLPYQVILLSELTPVKIHALEGIDAWVQIACPRLSIDWGEGFHKPVLTPYEAEVCMGGVKPWWEQNANDIAHTSYPMNYYEKGAGPWTSSYAKPAKGGSNIGGVLPHRRNKNNAPPTKDACACDVLRS